MYCGKLCFIVFDLFSFSILQMEEKSNVNLLAAGMHREAQQLIAEVF